jgi:hypothetical protein
VFCGEVIVSPPRSGASATVEVTRRVGAHHLDARYQLPAARDGERPAGVADIAGCVLHREGLGCDGVRAVTTEAPQSNRSRACRNGNWKMASRDWRAKATSPEPKVQNLPTGDRGAPA